jgi:hypothetical protein
VCLPPHPMKASQAFILSRAGERGTEIIWFFGGKEIIVTLFCSPQIEAAPTRSCRKCALSSTARTWRGFLFATLFGYFSGFGRACGIDRSLASNAALLTLTIPVDSALLASQRLLFGKVLTLPGCWVSAFTNMFSWSLAIS